MKKTIGLMASAAGIAALGSMAYILMSDTRTEHAKKVVNKTMDEAHQMMNKKLN